ncbi:MAG: lipoprotein insertase outer membrane protein LolB [Polaromonas sp.]|uniref:lipoprotein insertase outer membrane protein LolB n=1 Tax=Polaromonas sp. TaxID=1869339 RepID=UPI0024892FE3|nr:lipoprotein insertase outer membrane protein LolB [Polaromonas sp.]MDI1236972.1 lipoprotein insertase outer membrane protein LolB [Polaromonas sp.]MDI1339817.1 lipoprotein insertase outer membrane protein LolB [Polaromonas sp.]
MPLLDAPLSRLTALLASLLLATSFIAGCASTPRAASQNDEKRSFWSGRISLQVQSEPPQAFFAGFELKGNPTQGELTLNSPLGNSLAVLRWSPQEAVLDSGNQVQRFATVDELLEKATGAAVPLPALFDWLDGKSTVADGWNADLSQQAEGRISASRTMPQPRSDLRIVLAAP